ncbi:lytic transglycosylase domain-containing protein [Falsiroseomonas sp. CW058]|uniref:lytic transglycosylase domain-containing protein n=1 Tax=Falsiroseomonas sp. CW058 TaxID=3388664 RepID=UPI003D315612
MPLRLLSFLLLLLGASGAASAQRLPDPGLACRQAIRQVEREAALPPGLLMAIALVESGRADARGEVTPWAWAVRANGRGAYFAEREDAIREVLLLRMAGTTLIDAGCMQVNLHHHPDAFASPAHALDPLANVRYAARFLVRLHDEFGDWPAAVAAYHSRNAPRGEAYRARVLAAWPGGEEAAQLALAPIPLPPPEPPPFVYEVAEARD